MKRFKFKLEVVLQERKRTEDLKLREWVTAKNILQGMIDQRVALEKRLGEAIDEMTRLGGSDVSMAGVMDDFIRGQKLRADWKKREIERAEKFVERKRLEYIAAKQKTAALQKLKDNQLEEFKAAVRKHELKQLDDTYIMNGAYKTREREEETGV